MEDFGLENVEERKMRAFIVLQGRLLFKVIETKRSPDVQCHLQAFHPQHVHHRKKSRFLSRSKKLSTSWRVSLLLDLLPRGLVRPTFSSRGISTFHSFALFPLSAKSHPFAVPRHAFTGLNYMARFRFEKSLIVQLPARRREKRCFSTNNRALLRFSTTSSRERVKLIK